MITINLICLFTGIMIANSLDAQPYIFDETITINESVDFELEFPPVVTKITFSSFENNTEPINMSIRLYFSDYGKIYYYQILPGERLSSDSNWRLWNRPISDHFSRARSYIFHFEYTNNSQYLSVKIEGRTETFYEMLESGIYGGRGDIMVALVFFVYIVIPLIIFSFFLCISLLIYGLKSFKYEKRSIFIINSLIPFISLIVYVLINTNRGFVWFAALTVCFYYLTIIFFLSIRKFSFDYLYYWISIGITQVFISIALFVWYPPFKSMTFNNITVSLSLALFPLIITSMIAGLITIITSIVHLFVRHYSKNQITVS